MKRQSTLVVFNGGQDLTACLFRTLKHYDHAEIVTFSYGRRHSLKVEITKHIAAEQRIKNHLLDMSLLEQLTGDALTRDIAIENPGDDLPNTFVDDRNHLFLSFAAVLVKRPSTTDIITGACETDPSGYPDCCDASVKSLNIALNLVVDYNFVTQASLIWLDKSETWGLADQLGKLDYARGNTLTCYNGIKGSGYSECPTCKLHQAGLKRYPAKKG